MKSKNALSQSLGYFKSLMPHKHGFTIVTDYGVVRLLVYSAHIVRVSINRDGQFDDHSYAVIAATIGTPFEFFETPEDITLVTTGLRLIVQKHPVRLQLLTLDGRVINEDEPAFGAAWIKDQVTAYKKLQPNERFIGLGEKTGNLDRFGKAYTNWNIDYFGYPADGDPLYQTQPFYVGIHSGLVYGLFMDNSHKSVFNFGASNNRFASITAEDGDMNYYLIHHATVAEIISSYTYLTGRMPLPPLWSLGLQQCRYSYYPDSEVYGLARTFREKKIPADVIYLDIHYMDQYKIFTWHGQRFLSPGQMLKDLEAEGFKVVIIVDPGIKVEEGYKAYHEGVEGDLFLKYPDGTNYTGQVWPGWCHFPDFTKPATRQWWGQSLKGYINDGISGFWNDMNEPATWGQCFPDLVEFDHEGNTATHKKAHNVYGMQMARSTYEGAKAGSPNKRPFVLTRAGYAGVQRYSAVWTGDNSATDEHMLAGVRLLYSMGLTGLSFTGVDIGGFVGEPSRDLFGRWVTLGAFSPMFRIHTMIDNKESDPWSYGERIEEIARNYINFRYRLMPYIYSAFYESTQSGMPVIRTLAIAYTHDPVVYQERYQNQYLFGPAFLVAAVDSCSQFCKLYLPDDDGWYYLYNDNYYVGNQTIIVEAPVEFLPVFVRGGSIVPLQSLVQHLHQKPEDVLQLHIYSGKKGSTYMYYEDDGETFDYEQGMYYKRTMTLDRDNQTFTLDKAEGSFVSKFQYIKLVLHGFDNTKAISFEGEQLPLKAEELQFMEPLSSFDPLGRTYETMSAQCKTVLLPFKLSTMEVGFIE